ncbi:hypothetical protein QG37_03603 [Candidozyma auris]|uniref:Uncharacterized protein n=1 Tax=Candidozyma auris TaxID=498019 RepID=A0A0L0P0I1_CANAR|nr:hypothetical protein QG37_03603 [[Candida] auris]
MTKDEKNLIEDEGKDGKWVCLYTRMVASRRKASA